MRIFLLGLALPLVACDGKTTDSASEDTSPPTDTSTASPDTGSTEDTDTASPTTDSDTDTGTDTATGDADLDEDGYSASADCDDSDAYTYPGAAELCDGIQNDCDDTAWTDDNGLATYYSDTSAIPQDITAEVGGGTASLPTAYDFSDDGAVHFCEGTWYINADLTADLTVRGIGDREQVILHGARHTVFTIDGPYTVALENLTATGSNSYGNIFITSADVTIRDAVIRDGYSEGTAAGLYIHGGSLLLDGVDVLNNEGACYYSSCYGGGGVLARYSTIEVTDSYFSGNSAIDMAGGGLLADESFLTVQNSVFEDNESTFAGGGVALTDGSTATLTDCVFEGNDALSYAGGLLVDKSEATMTDCSFTANSAAAVGGAAVISRSSTLTLETCDFAENTPEDLYNSDLSEGYDLGESASYTCDNSGCY